MKIIFSVVAVLFSVLVQAQSVVLLGDTGKDNDGQQAVAQAIGGRCQQETCDLGFLLGDNVYPEGIDRPDDPKMEQAFGKYYRFLNFSFQVVLGNHDYGKQSNDWTKGTQEVGYSRINPQFILPSEFYGFETANAVVAAIDTTRLMWNKDYSKQADLVKTQFERARQTGKWFLVIGHHPYISNGQHGNAGNYDGLPFPSMVSGRDVKKFFQENICGRADFYISGHDHNLQVLDGNQQKCSLIQIVSGAGATVEGWREKNQQLFGVLTEGFMIARIQPQIFELEVYSSQGTSLFKKDFYKK